MSKKTQFRRTKDNFRQRLGNVLAHLHQTDGTHADANETLFLERQATFLSRAIHEVQRPEFKTLAFVPRNTELPADVQTWSYKVYDKVGNARVVANGAKDLPQTKVVVREEILKVVNVGDSYEWNINELRMAQRLSENLDSRLVLAAQYAIGNSIDEIVATGTLASTGQALDLVGFINCADVAIVNPANDPWSYASTTADQAINDINSIVNPVIENSKQVFIPDTLLLAPAEYNFIATKPRSANSDTTILSWLLENNPYIKNIDQWYRLAGSGAGGKNRMIAYKRDPMILEAVVPIEFESLAPQAAGLCYSVPCQGRTGGTVVYQPLGMSYGDFTPTTA